MATDWPAVSVAATSAPPLLLTYRGLHLQIQSAILCPGSTSASGWEAVLELLADLSNSQKTGPAGVERHPAASKLAFGRDNRSFALRIGRLDLRADTSWLHKSR